MNILIASDSFKDAISALDACKSIQAGLIQAQSSFQIKLFPLSDGGEGLSDILDFHLKLTDIAVEVSGPAFTPTIAHYNISQDCSVAFIEMAQAAGLQLLPDKLRNPLKTTTLGVGQLIQNAINHNVPKIILGLGGSATNDLGIGLATALGWIFLDKKGTPVKPIGENLAVIETIIPPSQNQPTIQVEVMCDVTNPLLGPKGAALTYAKQKGASEENIRELEFGASRFVQLSNQLKPIDPNTPGAGAAGGMGFGAMLFCNAQLKRGIDTILDLTDFDSHAKWADVIITGEGRLDHQTINGKLINGIISKSYGKKVIALCGAIDASVSLLRQLGITAAFPIGQGPTSLQQAIQETSTNLEKTAYQIGKLLKP